MQFTDAFIVALRSLRTARLRAALTMVGIIVGVAAVVLLVGLGTGLRGGFGLAFNQLSTKITVSKGTSNAPGNQVQPLTEADLSALERADPTSIARVLPLRSGTAVLRYGMNTFRGSVFGSTPDYPVLNSRTLQSGTFFDDQADTDRQRVVVISDDVVRYLFGGDRTGALGQTVYLGRIPLTVIGVLARDGQNDNIAVMPLSVSRLVLAGAENLNQIGVVATSPAQVPAAIDQIKKVIDDRHRIKDEGARDYRVMAQVVQLDKIFEFITSLTRFTVGVAALSLFVGALGVANIMLVTVAERTSEIGIRKALGARRSAILKQFLTEAVLLAGLGGLLGAGLGVVLTLLSASVIPKYVPQFGRPEIDPTAILVAVGVSLLIGLLAGGYPAWRAARMRPVEALRY